MTKCQENTDPDFPDGIPEDIAYMRFMDPGGLYRSFGWLGRPEGDPEARRRWKRDIHTGDPI